MSYEIDYSKQQNETEKRYCAIEDIITWSLKVYSIGFDLAGSGCKYWYYSYSMGMGGIKGYPCVALWDYVKECCQDMTQ